MSFIGKFFSFLKRDRTQNLGKVEFTDDEIIYFHPQDPPQRIAWNHLVEIGVVTTDEGPFVEDVFFLLIDSTQDQGCAIPQGAENMSELLTRLQELEGFDNHALIMAMSSTNNNRFKIWSSP